MRFALWISFCALILLAPAGPALGQTPVACYDFSLGHANDLCGARHGVPVGGQFTPEGYDFDGVDARIELPAGIVAGPTASWLFRVKPDTCAGIDPRAGPDDGGGGAGKGVALNLRPDCSMNAQISRGTNLGAISGPNLVEVGVEHHVAVVFNAGVVEFYRDGVFHSSASTAKTSIVLSDIPTWLGGRAVGSARWYNGTIRTVEFYNVALSAQEVADKAGAAPPPPPPPPPPVVEDCTYQRVRGWGTTSALPEDKCMNDFSAAFASVDAAVVLADGQVVYEKDPDTVLPVASVSKGIVGLCAAFSVAEDPAKFTPLLDDLLNHRAGWDNCLNRSCTVTESKKGAWHYSTYAFHEAALSLPPLGQTFEQFCNSRLSPIATITWDPVTNYGAGASLTMRDLAELGLFLSRGGTWVGVQLLNPDVLADFTHGGCNPGVPFGSPLGYASMGVDPPRVYCSGTWFLNNVQMAGYGHGAGCWQGGMNGRTTMMCVLDRDLVIAMTGPEWRSDPANNHLDGADVILKAVMDARYGRGMN